MSPISGAILNQAYDTCRPRSKLDFEIRPHFHELGVSSAYSEVQETLWIKNRLRNLAEGVSNGLPGRLGSERAIGMASHSINGKEQNSVRSRQYSDPILVFFAASDQAQFRIFYLQLLIPVTPPI